MGNSLSCCVMQQTATQPGISCYQTRSLFWSLATHSLFDQLISRLYSCPKQMPSTALGIQLMSNTMYVVHQSLRSSQETWLLARDRKIIHAKSKLSIDAFPSCASVTVHSMQSAVIIGLASMGICACCSLGSN